MTSNSAARLKISSSMARWWASGSRQLSSRRSARGAHGTSRARVTESPLANNVTSCPRSTSASVRNETTRSVPP